MKVQRLELQNFRNFEHVILDFTQPRTLLIGENGLGKSTVFDAIQWLLTGQCRGVDGKGAGQKDLIRFGADTMTVTGVIDGLGPAVSRSISRNGSATSTMPPDVILGKLGTQPGMLATVLSGQAFFTMHHADAKAMLMQLLNVRVPKDQLPGVDLPATMTDGADLATLEQLFDKAFQDRKTVKAQLASHQVPDAPKVVQIDLGGKTLADVQKQLAKDTTAGLALQRDLSKREQTLTDVKTKLADAQKLAGSLEQLKGALTAHQGMLTNHEGDLVANQAALQAANDEPAEPTGALEVQLREVGSLIDKIQRHTTTITPAAVKSKRKPAGDADAAAVAHACVLSADIPCLTAISLFQGQVATLQANQKDLEARIKAGTERARKIAAATQAMKESERHVTYHQGQVRDTELKIAQADEAVKAVPGLFTDVATAAAEVGDAKQAVTDYKANIERRGQQVAALASYEAAMQTHRTAADRKADLQKQVDKAEALVDLLGPKGIRLKYLDAALADFQVAINAALEPFGFSVAINVEPWRVEVTMGDDVTNTARFEMLSTGQKVWTALAFQLTLAALSGLEFCVLDNAETVVGFNRGILTELILGAPVGQVLVAMAKAEDDAVPAIDGLQVIQVGSLQPVGV